MTARGEAALARLGGGTATRPRSSTYLTDGLTVEEIERDAASIHRILNVWKRIGNRAASTIVLPSGKVLEPKSKGPSGRLESRPRKRRGARP